MSRVLKSDAVTLGQDCCRRSRWVAGVIVWVEDRSRELGDKQQPVAGRPHLRQHGRFAVGMKCRTTRDAQNGPGAV
jgi:hypothetical protein